MSDKQLKILDLTHEGEHPIVADGFDEAIVGMTEDARVVYSVDKILRILKERDGMDEEGAEEYFSFNISGSLGEGMPVYVYYMEGFADGR